MTVRHGWFSPIASNRLNDPVMRHFDLFRIGKTYLRKERPRRTGSVWATPDGREVVVTLVTPTPEPCVSWPDIEYVGLVTEWIRSASEEDLVRLRGGGRQS